MTTERPELHRICGLKELPAGGIPWHLAITAGLPVRGVRRMATAIGVSEGDLAELLGIDEATLSDRDALLPRDVSNFLYRIGLALTRAAVKTGKDFPKAALWLRSAQPTLKDNIPILLLQSHVGTEYVFAAVDRMESPKDQLIHEAEAPDAGTAEFEHHMAEDDNEDEVDEDGDPVELR